MIPASVASVASAIFITGTSKKGIKITGFNTIGKPKIIISLIPKIAGIMDNLPSCFIRSDLAIVVIKSTSDKVEPPPPKLPKKSENGPVKMYGIIGSPAKNAAWFANVIVW